MSQQNASTELVSFVRASKEKGASDEFLASLLARRGWPLDDVYTALGDYWATATGLPVPGHRRAAESARDAFLYLLSFVTLGIWVCALGTILFQLVNYWIPDPASPNYGYGFRSLVTWNLAALAVSFPVFLLVMRQIFAEARKSPEQFESGVRKWLTYLALLLAAGTVIGDLIAFLGFFLMGELSLRFVLKELIVLVLAGGVFAYYLASLRWDRKTDVPQQRSRNRSYTLASATVVVLAFIAGMVVVGMPQDQRQFALDQRRVEDLRAISRAVRRWHSTPALSGAENTGARGPNTGEGTLPASLEQLKDRRWVARIADPATSTPYEYRRFGETSYELCAAFAQPTQEQNRLYGDAQFWNHGAGRTCFVLDAADEKTY